MMAFMEFMFGLYTNLYVFSSITVGVLRVYFVYYLGPRSDHYAHAVRI